MLGDMWADVNVTVPSDSLSFTDVGGWQRNLVNVI